MLHIGITDTLGSSHKFQQYISWLKSGNEEVHCEILSYREQNQRNLDRCDALMLTGGHDVDPLLYHGPEHHPKITDVNRQRDDFELELLYQCQNQRLPLLGICRGMQLTNVFFDGTLLPDIEEAGHPSHKSKGDEAECRHEIVLDCDSTLTDINGGNINGNVNSSHHQAVLKPGEGLCVIARSTDGIIEALEMKDDSKFPFLLLVQWHPERMHDQSNPLASGVLQKFFKEIHLSHSKKIIS